MRDTYTDTDWYEEFVKYATEMGSDAVMYISSFIKIGSAIQKLLGGHTDSKEIAQVYFQFFRIRKLG
jgi:hypothetical protein